MVYVSRKIVYPVFILFFTIIFFSIIFLVSFNQVLSVDDASIEIVGGKIILKSNISNISNHLVRDSKMLIQMDEIQSIVKIKDLSPGEKFEVISELPFVETLKYEVFVSSPFSKSIKLFFEIDETTVRPVKAQVQLASNMIIGKKYDVVVSLCNVSNNDLFEVIWLENTVGKYFDESFFQRSVPLKINECKNLYSTLTPITPGEVQMDFILRVGSLEQKYSHKIIIEAI